MVLTFFLFSVGLYFNLHGYPLLCSASSYGCAALMKIDSFEEMLESLLLILGNDTELNKLPVKESIVFAMERVNATTTVKSIGAVLNNILDTSSH